MPSADEILTGLTLIANEGKSIALVWHVLIAAALTAVVLGWRPRERTASTLAVLPIASSVGAALVYRNPFNVALLAIGTVALLVLAWGSEVRASGRGPVWTQAAGVLFLAFGWVYPHFLVDEPRAVYLIAAPVGLLPCPSLSVAIGFVLLMGAAGTRAYRIVLAALGLFYGLFGVLRLGVALDVGLIAASFVLAATAFVNVGAKNAAPRAAA